MTSANTPHGLSPAEFSPATVERSSVLRYETLCIEQRCDLIAHGTITKARQTHGK